MVDVRVKDLSTMKTNTSRSLLRRLKVELSFIVSTNRKTVDLNRAALYLQVIIYLFYYHSYCASLLYVNLLIILILVTDLYQCKKKSKYLFKI